MEIEKEIDRRELQGLGFGLGTNLGLAIRFKRVSSYTISYPIRSTFQSFLVIL